MRPFTRRLRVPQSGHPAVRALFSACNRERIGLYDLADRSGVNVNTIKSWRLTAVPSIENLEACLNVVGLRLLAQPDPRKE